jgi:hypothetical protein
MAGYKPAAVCGLILDRAGKEPEVSKENLNLAFRQRIPMRIIDRAHLSAAALEGLDAVHAIDLAQPTDSERSC